MYIWTTNYDAFNPLLYILSFFMKKYIFYIMQKYHYML